MFIVIVRWGYYRCSLGLLSLFVGFIAGGHMGPPLQIHTGSPRQIHMGSPRQILWDCHNVNHNKMKRPKGCSGGPVCPPAINEQLIFCLLPLFGGVIAFVRWSYCHCSLDLLSLFVGFIAGGHMGPPLQYFRHFIVLGGVGIIKKTNFN